MFQPRMHNQLEDEGKAVGELPILYYAVGKLYHLFGVHNWVYRGLWWLITFIGYFCLFKFCSEFLKDKVWGLLISAFTFTSPILIIYGVSFIPDSVALSFLFVSWFFIYRYYQRKKTISAVLAILFASLSALLKLPTLITILALSIVYVVFSLKKIIQGQLKVKSLLPKLFYLGIIFTALIGWYSYAAYYNQLHQSSYFFLKSAPIWEASTLEMNRISAYLFRWSKEFLYDTARHVLYGFALLLLLPIFKRHFKQEWYWIYLLSTIGFFAFFALFYQQFMDHDYYWITLTFMIPLTVLFTIKKFQFLLDQKKMYKHSFQLLFCTLLVASSIHGAKKANNRFSKNTSCLNDDLFELRAQLNGHGIGEDDLIIVPHDPSPNITLYAINRNGWTKLNGLQDKASIEQKIKSGAKWMLVSDKCYYQNDNIDAYMQDLVVSFKGIKIYKLSSLEKQITPQS